MRHLMVLNVCLQVFIQTRLSVVSPSRRLSERTQDKIYASNDCYSTVGISTKGIWGGG